jgi:hypothetical protein
MTTQLGYGVARTWAIVLLAAVALGLLYLIVMGLRNRTIQAARVYPADALRYE